MPIAQPSRIRWVCQVTHRPEVTDHLIRLGGLDEQTAALYVERLGLQPTVALDAALGAAAGSLRARLYHRTRRAVSMADCVAAAAARTLAEPSAISDPHLLDLCHEERISTVVLPGSDGSGWTSP